MHPCDELLGPLVALCLWSDDQLFSHLLVTVLYSLDS